MILHLLVNRQFKLNTLSFRNLFTKGIIRAPREHVKLPSKNGRYGMSGGTKFSLSLVAMAATQVSAPANYDMPLYRGDPNFGPHPIEREIFISWNQFCYLMLAKGEVARILIYPSSNRAKIVLHDGAVIEGKRLRRREYFMQISSPGSFENKIRDFEQSKGIPPDEGVSIANGESKPVTMLIPTIMLAFLMYKLFKSVKFSGPQSMMSAFTKVNFTLVDPSNKSNASNTVRFRDVAGLREAKVEVMEFIDYLKNSERYLKLGAKLPKGVLLLGPPGCGKTMLAKAIATESNVPFLALAGSDFVEMIGGVGASRVRSLFKQANKLAPCIIYIDEIDSIGKKRSESSHGNGEMERTLNQLLVEMDGLVSRKSVILLASTNRADVLDAALLRPGRFDRQILIDLPNLLERREIFERHASSIKLDESPSVISHRIAQLTPGMSGADIANVCNEAALHAARKDKTFVNASDFEYAIERVVGGTEKRSSAMTLDERRIIAYHECGHALVGWLLKHADPILKVSIVPRTTNILGYAQYIPSDRKLHSPEEFFDRMCMALGGRVAELITFNHLSTGAQDDLQKVTKMATAQVEEYGFDAVVGHISFPKQAKDFPGEKPYSKRLACVIDQRVSILVRKAFDRTYEILNANTDKLRLLAENLITKEVMSSDDIEKLIGPRVGPCT